MNDTWITALQDENLDSIKQQLAENPSLASQNDGRLDIMHDGQFAFSPLRFALEKDNREMVKALLDAGADINGLDPFGNALQVAKTSTANRQEGEPGVRHSTFRSRGTRFSDLWCISEMSAVGQWIENKPCWFVIDRKGIITYAAHRSFATPTSYIKEVDDMLEALKKAAR